MKKCLQRAVAMGNKTKAAGAGLFVAVASSSAHAGTIAEDIAAATTSGQTNVGLVVTGLIGMAALGFGVTMIVGFLRR